MYSTKEDRQVENNRKPNVFNKRRQTSGEQQKTQCIQQKKTDKWRTKKTQCIYQKKTEHGYKNKTKTPLIFQTTQYIHQMKTEHEYNKETTTTKKDTIFQTKKNPIVGGVVFVAFSLNLCIIILRARHDHNKTAPCGMIQVFLIGLNVFTQKRQEHDYKKTTKSKVFTTGRQSMDTKSNNTMTFQQR